VGATVGVLVFLADLAQRSPRENFRISRVGVGAGIPCAHLQRNESYTGHDLHALYQWKFSVAE